MPKPTILLDKYAIDELRSHIALKTGFVITGKSDCIRLADIMNKSDAGPVSASTLYRLFFKESENVPYKNTLDLVSQFIGYKSAAAYREYISSRREFLINSGIYVNHPCKSLLFYCIDSKSDKPLLQYFEDLQSASHDTKWSVGIALFDDLQRTSSQRFFFEIFSANTFVRNYLLENLHDPKFRLAEFETAYLCYLKATPKKDSIDSLKDRLFGKTVLFRYYYILKRFNDAKNIGKQIYHGCFDSDEFKKELHPYVWARYESYKIWYMQLIQESNIELESYAIELILKAKMYAENKSRIDTDAIVHTLLETIFYADLPLNIHCFLKDTFKSTFDMYGKELSQKTMNFYLKYLDRNGLMFMRP